MSENRREFFLEDGVFYESKRIITSDAWREKSIIQSWGTEGWEHVETKEFGGGNWHQIHIHFKKRVDLRFSDS